MGMDLHQHKQSPVWQDWDYARGQVGHAG